MTTTRIHPRGWTILVTLFAASVALYVGAAAGHLMLAVVVAAVFAGVFVRHVRRQRARVKQARYERRQRRRAQLRLSEPEVWLERFLEELDDWDMTVESLLVKAGPEPPAEFVHTAPPPLYDQDEDSFGDLL